MKPILTGIVLLALGLLYVGCTPEYPRCKSDEHCKEQGEFCVDGSCKKCRDDKDCGGNRCIECVASTYTCERRLGCCSADLDCPGGRCWFSPGKSTGKCGAMCRTNKDCDDHDPTCKNGCRCDNGVCRKSAQCHSDADCAPNQLCDKAVCRNRIPCGLETVYFDFDESKLREDAKKRLDHSVSCIKLRRGPVKIEGHCDQRGTAEYNLALGARRAKTVKQYLVNSGIPRDRLTTVSFGKERPECTTSNEECWKRNRRVVSYFY